MQTVTETQLERRIDDFRADVDHRFDAIDKRFEGADKRFEGVEAELVRLRSEMKAGFERMDDRFEQLYRLLFGAAASAVVALIGLIATQL